MGLAHRSLSLSPHRATIRSPHRVHGDPDLKRYASVWKIRPGVGVVWHFDTGGGAVAFWVYGTAVYVGSGDHLFKLDAATGALIWRVTLAAGGINCVKVSSTWVYAVGNDALFALDPADGNIQWTKSGGRAITLDADWHLHVGGGWWGSAGNERNYWCYDQYGNLLHSALLTCKGYFARNSLEEFRVDALSFDHQTGVVWAGPSMMPSDDNSNNATCWAYAAAINPVTYEVEVFSRNLVLGWDTYSLNCPGTNSIYLTGMPWSTGMTGIEAWEGSAPPAENTWHQVDSEWFLELRYAHANTSLRVATANYKLATEYPVLLVVEKGGPPYYLGVVRWAWGQGSNFGFTTVGIYGTFQEAGDFDQAHVYACGGRSKDWPNDGGEIM